MNAVVGFVGLGRMGAPMAARLAAAGHQVLGFDLAGSRDRVPAGVGAVDRLEMLLGQAETLLLSLPDGRASGDVCQQVAAASNRVVSAVVDLSTVGIASAQASAALLRSVGVEYLDAPVSGGVAGARGGTLAVMAAGPAPLYGRLLPLLRVIGSNCFLVGSESGQAQAMKLLNNYCSAAAMAATSEAVVFGARLGLDLAQMIDVLNASSGRSAASSDKFPRSVLPRRYDFGFAGALMAKDVRLYLDAASNADAPRDLATAVVNLWQEFDAANPGADFTAIHRYLERRGSSLRGALKPRPEVPIRDWSLVEAEFESAIASEVEHDEA